MTSVPTGSAVVVSVATPLPFNVTVPRVAPPVVKVTVPVGVPDADFTVAVSATLPPATMVVGLAITVVVVAFAVTVTVTGEEVEAAKSVVAP